MELLKIKCNYCDRVSVVKTKLIASFYGRLIQLRCGNPICSNQLKIRVPEANNNHNQ